MIHITLDPRSPLPLHEQIKDHFRFLIVSGAMEDGAQLPSIRALAMELNVNPNTVARVYRDLEGEHFVESRQGSGCFVSAGEARAREEQRYGLLKREIRSLVVKAQALGVSREKLAGMIKEESHD
ncbi:MAG TPA: GntR family transcriptional regulator [Thermoanaerobaculia bacterium]|nr:GntR family transcriptional regulator [Thermoanaerobaculia bacterium]HUM30095.1 GntR family transcriptional regulator [Thermoanaerobaculia bacterium]HXK68792.1 GntR family transcriptional regulator [Thermoanaerobaculia bacterium]